MTAYPVPGPVLMRTDRILFPVRYYRPSSIVTAGDRQEACYIDGYVPVPLISLELDEGN